MKNSITLQAKAKKIIEKTVAAVIWLIIWQCASNAIKQEMLLASPVSVARRLAELLGTEIFWKSVGFSLSRVSGGFLLALLVGIILAAVAYKIHFVDVLLQPLITIAKTAPVVSYIILCLLFLSSKNISISISFLMGLPIIYTNVLQGLHSTDKNLLQMAEVFGVPMRKQIVFIYFSQIMPFLVSACNLSLGMCWKAAIAAEVIGLPLGSIGENMYQAKIFVDTKSLLAWTAVVIAISFLFERTAFWLLKKLMFTIERR